MRVKWVVLVVLLGCNARLGTPIGPDVTGADAKNVGHDSGTSVVADAAPDANTCVGGDAHMVDADGNCLLLFTTPKTFASATTACAGLPGGHLVKVTNAAQNTLLATLVAPNDAFIGATDAVTEGTYLWADGTPLVYTHFRLGEPNNGNGGGEEDCLVIEGKKVVPDTWDDRPCMMGISAGAGAYAYVCEF
jgi:hypothetical protein